MLPPFWAVKSPSPKISHSHTPLGSSRLHSADDSALTLERLTEGRVTAEARQSRGAQELPGGIWVGAECSACAVWLTKDRYEVKEDHRSTGS
jgi:hypothetical protein